MKMFILFILIFLIFGCSTKNVVDKNYIEQIIQEKNKEIEGVKNFYKNHINSCIDIYKNSNRNKEEYSFVFYKKDEDICIESSKFIIFLNILDLITDREINSLIKCLKMEE